MVSFLSIRLLAVFCLLTIIGHALAYDPQYCSDENTASTAQNSSIFQSSGLCHDFCVDDYAFAVLQEHDCWCTNYTPDSTTSLDDCTYTCPGYPADNCGGPGLYAYIPLIKAPLGVKGAGGGAAGATSTGGQTSIQSGGNTLTAGSMPSSSSSMTWTATPVTSLETITGQVRTVTVTPTSPPSTSQNLGATSKSTSNGGSLTTGGAVGLTVGLVALVAIVCALIYFCVRKGKGVQAEEIDKDVSRRGSSSGVLDGPVPQRTMSENSRYLLNTDGQRVVETWEDRDQAASRRSRLMPVDPRLNPFAPVYQRGDNRSRESVNTIRDDHDYSRRVQQQGPILRATNPDESLN